MTPPDTYQELSRDEATQILDGTIQHAAHVMLYAKVDERLLQEYDTKYAILVSCSLPARPNCLSHFEVGGIGYQLSVKFCCVFEG